MSKRITEKKKPGKGAKAAPVDAPPFRPFAKLAKRIAVKPPAAPPKPKSTTSAKRDEDAGEVDGPASFHEHMRGVKPLRAPAKRIPKTASELDEARGAARAKKSGDLDGEARARLHALVTDAIRFEVSDDGTSLEGRRIDVDPRELRRLRTQRYAVDGKLDLHGMRSSEARVAVAKFLTKRASEGDRAILIVHGKGNHSPRGDAILRGELGAWLSQGVASRNVLAFASVLDRSGESGSLFVLLTR